MSELDAEIGPLALELIAEYGKDVTYTGVAAKDYDPETASAIPGGPDAPKDVKAVVEDYNLQASGQAFASGLIQAGDKKFTVAALSFGEAKPTVNGSMFMDGITYSIVNIKAVYSGELVAIYEIQGRA